jgi:hypothetical protein
VSGVGFAGDVGADSERDIWALGGDGEMLDGCVPFDTDFVMFLKLILFGAVVFFVSNMRVVLVAVLFWEEVQPVMLWLVLHVL